MLEIWSKWIAAFDEAAAGGSWTKAGEYLTDDVTYIVAGAPFACELKGKNNVLAGFEKSITGFDRKFDTRFWEAVGTRDFGGQAITARAYGRYTLADCPPMSFAAMGNWFFRDDKICLMTDIYDLAETDTMQALEWLGRYGAGMDASYA